MAVYSRIIPICILDIYFFIIGVVYTHLIETVHIQGKGIGKDIQPFHVIVVATVDAVVIQTACAVAEHIQTGL